MCLVYDLQLSTKDRMKGMSEHDGKPVALITITVEKLIKIQAENIYNLTPNIY